MTMSYKLYIDITRNHTKKDLRNFLTVSKYKNKFDLFNLQSKIIGRKIQYFHFSFSKLICIQMNETN